MKTFRNFGLAAILSVFAALAAPSVTSGQTTRRPSKPKVQTAKVVIRGADFLPGTFTLKRGILARITFQRMSEDTCGTEIVIPDYGINRPLPLYENVVVSFTPKKAGEIGFSCGMNMMRGKIVVR